MTEPPAVAGRKPLTIFMCGPSQGECVCHCPGSCDHVWNGPIEKDGCLGASATCSKCGKLAMAHDLMVMP